MRVGWVLACGALTAPLAAQGPVELAAGPAVTGPAGTLARYLGVGYGADLSLRLGPRRVGLRVAGEYAWFPQATRARPFAGGTVMLTTGLRVLQFTGGPEWRVGVGRLQAGVGAGVGVARYASTSAVSGIGDPDRFTRAVTYDDLAWAATAGAGLALRLGAARAPLAVRLEGRYARSGDLRIVREENLPTGVLSGVYLPPTPTPGARLTGSLLVVVPLRR